MKPEVNGNSLSPVRGSIALKGYTNTSSNRPDSSKAFLRLSRLCVTPILSIIRLSDFVPFLRRKSSLKYPLKVSIENLKLREIKATLRTEAGKAIFPGSI